MACSFAFSSSYVLCGTDGGATEHTRTLRAVGLQERLNARYVCVVVHVGGGWVELTSGQGGPFRFPSSF